MLMGAVDVVILVADDDCSFTTRKRIVSGAPNFAINGAL